MVAAPDLGSGAVRRVGSSPIRRTENGFNRFLQAEFIKSIFFVHWGIDSARLNHILSIEIRKLYLASEFLRFYVVLSNTVDVVVYAKS